MCLQLSVGCYWAMRLQVLDSDFFWREKIEIFSSSKE